MDNDHKKHNSVKKIKEFNKWTSNKHAS